MKRLIATAAVALGLMVPASADAAYTTLTFGVESRGFAEQTFAPPFYPERVSVANFWVDGLGKGRCDKRVNQSWYCERGRKIGAYCSPSFLGVTCQVWNKKPFGITASLWVRARRAA